MKRRTLLRSTVAAALGALLLTPGVGAAVCAMEGNCGMMPAPAEAETTAHCAAMEPTADRDPSEMPESDRASSIDCCPEPATLGDPVPALARSADSIELRPAAAYSTGSFHAWPLDLSRNTGGRSRQTQRSSPPSGAELRTLHQSFLI